MDFIALIGNQMENINRIKVIGFDADDTLWVNESF